MSRSSGAVKRVKAQVRIAWALGGEVKDALEGKIQFTGEGDPIMSDVEVNNVRDRDRVKGKKIPR